ncbi:hypothetical protein EJ08DRAFT_653099 [Tothia fuscella]|uniref:Uncharacterized protein n=1 Tax=Tothia fuscella TaxID=1048955 RepID=A0A9P4TU43_9PEZI|nr:hypothetical protein EJ08DRAFT_653099 [Tothia fuscella]
MNFNTPSQVQFAPWYIAFLKRQSTKFKISKDLFNFKATAMKLAMPVTAKTIFSPIDSVSLLDKVILHELTHAARAGVSIDIRTDLTFFRKAYGWKECGRITEEPRLAGEFNSPQRNADSLALFALGHEKTISFVSM